MKSRMGIKMHVIVIGGGAAGMMAALAAARGGCKVTLIEKNEKLGKKLYITGKGRCNLTNASDMETVFQNVCSNPRFLYSAFYALDNTAVIDLFESLGMKTKTERGSRVFPASDHASDVTQALKRELMRLHVEICLQTEVQGIRIKTSAADCSGTNPDMDAAGRAKPQVCGVQINGKRLDGDSVIVATGGLSYPSTGSTGDGYHFAEAAGHRIVKAQPALVPLEVKEADAAALQGLSLKNVTLSVYDKKRCLFSEFGELLFTHFGLSGPLILSASSCVTRLLNEKQRTLRLEIDLKPALSAEQLNKRLLREFDTAQNKQLKNVLPALLPAKLVPVIIARSGISGDKRIHEITRAGRECLVQTLKHLTFTAVGTRGFNEAIITQGGVSTKEINPSTMESKLVHGLYFAGETIDVDALTGGYNLQIAWSTGYLAGVCASQRLQACGIHDAGMSACKSSGIIKQL